MQDINIRTGIMKGQVSTEALRAQEDFESCPQSPRAAKGWFDGMCDMVWESEISVKHNIIGCNTNGVTLAVLSLYTIIRYCST